MHYKEKYVAILIGALAVGCGSDDAPADTDAGQTDPTSGESGQPDTEDPGETETPDTDADTDPDPDTGSDSTSSGGEVDEGLLQGPTRGGPIQINDAGDRLAVANKATDDVTIFSLPDMTQTGRVDVGDEPVSVAWAPDGSTLYVVNRSSGTVSKVLDAQGDAPVVDSDVYVGSETIAGALTPRGRTLYVTSWVDGTLSAVDTDSMEIDSVLNLGGAPYATCITNDADEDEDDETVFVTDFYGRPGDGREGTDAARTGRVFRVSTADGAVETSRLAAHADSGVPGFEATGFYPNQLYSCVVNLDNVYVSAVGASPEAFEGTTDFHQNVQGMVSVLDLDGNEVDARSVNLNAIIDPLEAPKRFVAVPADIAFAPNSDFGYIASTASNSVLRVDWSQSPPVAGSPSGASFLATAPSPTGIAIADARAYTYNEVDRSVSVIDLAEQETTDLSIASAPQPTSAAEEAELRGQRFFNTGLARWSTNGWVSCLACHPQA